MASGANNDGNNQGTPGRLVSNPFIKKRNLEWRISPPPLKRARKHAPSATERKQEDGDITTAIKPSHVLESTAISTTTPTTAAAIEAGSITITDHSSHFSTLLSRASLTPYPPYTPRLSTAAYKALYDSSLNNPHGAHFVIHQHDHPVAGTHYDLRLQINGTSSASWAVMYGPPGDPNSSRPNRNATETRVHCLWSHLIETASAHTGSLLIWDTGTYRVLPRRSKHDPAVDPESGEESGEESGDEDGSGSLEGMTEQQKLHAAFSARKIKLQLDGARLPGPYVINLRLTKADDATGRAKAIRAAAAAPSKRRTRRATSVAKKKHQVVETSSSSESDSEPGSASKTEKTDEAIPTDISAMERELYELRELEDEQVRRTNAYPGANNTIGSVHQRRWYLSLDRAASGFVKRQRRDGGSSAAVWERGEAEGGQQKEEEEAESENGGSSGRLEYPFYVRGTEHERSVVTGRLGADILRDEGVEGFVGRKGWRAVLR